MQGTVQRLVLGDGMPRVEHRTRDLSAMFVETEWGWSARAAEAYVFRHFERAMLPSTAYEISAESHAEALRLAREISRASRDASVAAQAREWGAAPAQVYAETNRRLGERD